VQRDRELAHLREAMEHVKAAHQEVRMWGPLSVMNDFVAIEAELRTILSRL
jgi:Xaa-Pro aminopeptidase